MKGLEWADNNLNNSRIVGETKSSATLRHTHSMEPVMKSSNNKITMDNPERQKLQTLRVHYIYYLIVLQIAQSQDNYWIINCKLSGKKH